MPVGNFTHLLKDAGFRATPARVRLLELLAREEKPLTVEEIANKLGKNSPNEVTLYRALEALEGRAILGRTELGHGHAHWELAAGKKHHHHLVCTVCGRIEDFSSKMFEAALKKITSGSFKKITNHSVELFGLCANCA